MAEAWNILKLDLAAIDIGEVALALGEPSAHDKDLPVWARS
jgi:hypothetical protein